MNNNGKIYFQVSKEFGELEDFIKLPRQDLVQDIIDNNHEHIPIVRICNAIIFSCFLMKIKNNISQREFVKDSTGDYIVLHSGKVATKLNVGRKKYYQMLKDSIDLKLLNVEYKYERNPRVIFNKSIIYDRLYNVDKEKTEYYQFPIKYISEIDSRSVYLLAQILNKSKISKYSKNINNENGDIYISMMVEDLMFLDKGAKRNRNRNLSSMLSRLSSTGLVSYLDCVNKKISKGEEQRLREKYYVVYQIDSHTLVTVCQLYIEESNLTVEECVRNKRINIVTVERDI